MPNKKIQYSNNPMLLFGISYSNVRIYNTIPYAPIYTHKYRHTLCSSISKAPSVKNTHPETVVTFYV